MPRVTCRCGEILKIAPDSSDRVVCPQCGAKIRVRRTPKMGDIDGFIRFACPCGRRLKVRGGTGAEAGKCPDCGRVVPVPPPAEHLPPDNVEVQTQELSAEDLARLDQWAKDLRDRAAGIKPSPPARPTAAAPAPTATKTEAGLRVCPNCGRPVHLSASVCRHCGAAVPKR